MIVPLRTKDMLVEPAPPLRPGAGSMLTANGLGAAVSAQRGAQNFNHPFRPFPAGLSLTFTVGTVRSSGGIGPIIPTIGGVPMNGANGDSNVPLPLKAEMQNSDGLSWAVLEVHPDPTTGELIAGSVCEIVHANNPTFGVNANTGAALTAIDPNIGRCPLVQIQWSGNVPGKVSEIVMFNLQYQRFKPAPGGGAVAHFFF